jgi:hypothetical protein
MRTKKQKSVPPDPTPPTPESSKMRGFRFRHSEYETWRVRALQEGIGITDLIRKAMSSYLSS